MAAAVAVLVLALVLGQRSSAPKRVTSTAGASRAKPAATRPAVRRPAAALPVARSKPQPPRPLRLSYGVGRQTLSLVDPSRTISTSTGTVPRAFRTIVRYPIPSGDGQPAGPFPLIVFGHGFAVTPQPYSLLLDAWTKAGYVVAAPVFPLENADAPGGPSEPDLVNQPQDMSLVISSLTLASQRSSGPLAGMIDPRHIAVAGQSDGGDTALAAAYEPGVRDARVRAAMILSGAEDPFAPAFALTPNGPPLLAVQGTADTINPPDATYFFYRQAAPPKYLLRLLGAGHQPPYTEPGPQLAAVQRMTIAFLDYFFKGRRGNLQRLLSAGTAGGDSALTSAG